MARRVTSHTHIGALVIGTTFLGVLLAGTLWKLTAGYLSSSQSPLAQSIGAGMFFQYS